MACCLPIDIFYDIVHSMPLPTPSVGQFAFLVREARRGCALSQRQLARRARTTQAVVARVELGWGNPTVGTIRRLLAAAGYELDATLVPKPLLDRQVLDDVPRVLALSPEDRLREVANLSRFITAGKRRG